MTRGAAANDGMGVPAKDGRFGHQNGHFRGQTDKNGNLATKTGLFRGQTGKNGNLATENGHFRGQTSQRGQSGAFYSLEMAKVTRKVGLREAAGPQRMPR